MKKKKKDRKQKHSFEYLIILEQQKMFETKMVKRCSSSFFIFSTLLIWDNLKLSKMLGCSISLKSKYTPNLVSGSSRPMLTKNLDSTDGFRWLFDHFYNY